MHDVIKVADMVLERGHIPFIPHLTHFWHFLSPKPWETWMEIDEVILLRCDSVLRLFGESVGADREVELALKNSIRVYYNLHDIPDDWE